MIFGPLEWDLYPKMGFWHQILTPKIDFWDYILINKFFGHFTQKLWVKRGGGQGLFTDSKEGLKRLKKRSQNRSKLGKKNKNKKNIIFRGVWSIMTFFRGVIYTSSKF